ncbi:exopolysaccharide biosynthesis protein [Tropicibacter alexandrii]|uniref:nucleotide-binding protein n=1 Tax=Tropicibacter alexandrii TaxID=2267683 RepID=UPI001F0C01C6|nr:exopolysaccharide biosynthesis protein [Tropicibacter alexandrii]
MTDERKFRRRFKKTAPVDEMDPVPLLESREDRLARRETEAAEDARRKEQARAAEAARIEAEQRAQAEEEARQAAEEQARRVAEAKARKASEEKARRAAAAKAEADRLAKEKAHAEAVARKRKAEAAARADAEARAKAEAVAEAKRRKAARLEALRREQAAAEANAAAAARAAEEARRRAQEASAAEEAELRKAEEARRAEEQRKAEEAQRAEEKRKAEEAQRAEEKRQAEEARSAEAKRKAEEAQRAEEQRKAEEARRAEEKRKAEEARRAEEKRKAEEARRAEDQRKAEEAQRAEEKRKTEHTAPARARIEAQPAAHDPWDDLATFKVDEEHLAENRIITAQRDDPAHAAFDVLRTRLLQALNDNGWRRVAITSPGKDCGKTFTAANLAISLSRQENCRTLLMDCDMRRPSLHKTMGISTPGAMGDLLRGTVDPGDHLMRMGSNRIHAGRNIAFGFNNLVEPYASELLQDPSTARTLDLIESRYDPDVMLFDLPPALFYDDVIAFRPLFDGVLLVIGGGLTTEKEVKEVERRLGEQTPLLGVVLNMAEGTEIERYRY